MFGGGFKAPKCKTLLRLAMARIKLLRNKRDIQIKQMRKEIAQLLSSGQEPSARIRVEHIAREQNILAAYDIVELFCELLIVRLPIIESQKVCPMDLKEGVASLIFAAPRCADLPELLQIRSLFSSKYGKEFVAAAAELRPDCGVNRRIIEKLSVRAPSGEVKLKLLTEIAEEHKVNWDPADSEAQLLQQPEDLLDGPKKFFGSSQAPAPEAESSARKSPEPSSYQQRVPSARHPAAPTPQAPSPPPSQPPCPPPSQPTYPHTSQTAYPPPGPPSRPAPQAGRPAPGPQSRSVPSVVRPRGAAPPSSSDSDDDSPVPEKQFIPFMGPAPSDGLAAAKGNQQPPARRESKEPNPASRRPDPTVESEKSHGYNDVTEAAAAAAQHADRAKAAAHAAAELARAHPSRSNSHSYKTPASKVSSSEEETSSEEEDTATSQRAATTIKPSAPPRQPEDVPGGPSRKISGGGEGSLSRNSSESRDEGLFRSGSYHEEHANSFSRWKSPLTQPDIPSEPAQPPLPKMDSGQETFWRSGDEDKWPSTSLTPDSRDSGDFSYTRGSDPFSGGEPDDPFTRLPKDTAAYAPTTPKLFSSSDSTSNLFNRSNSEERGGARTFDEAPSYDSKPAFDTPKFDDDDDAGDSLPSYGKQSSISSDSTFKDYDLPRSYYRNDSRPSGMSSRDFDTERPTYGSSTTSSKVTMQEYWNSSPYFKNENLDNTTTSSPETFDTAGREEKSRSGSLEMKDSRYDDVPSQNPDARDSFSGMPSPSSRGYEEEAPKGDRMEQSAPIPAKSRRTRNGSKGRDKLETAGGSAGSAGSLGSMGSGGLPPPPGRRATFIETKELSRSPEYYSAVKPDNSPGQSVENSPTFPPKTSLSFYNNSMPRGGGGAYASLERKVSPGTGTLDRKSSPSSSGLDRKTSPSSSSLDRKFSPSALDRNDSNSLERQDSPSNPLHPKMPDIDDLTARFGALKERAKR